MYKAVYKCRICGDEVQDDDHIYTLKDIKKLKKLPKINGLTCIHDCEDAPIEGTFKGFMDFIGFVEIPEEDKNID